MTNATWKGGAKFASTAICRNTLSTYRSRARDITDLAISANLQFEVEGRKPKTNGTATLIQHSISSTAEIEMVYLSFERFQSWIAEIFDRKKRKMKTMNASQRPPLLSSYSRCDLKENIITFFLSTCEKYYILWASLKLCHLRLEHLSIIFSM